MGKQTENISGLAKRQDAQLKKTVWRMLQNLRNQSSVNDGNIAIDIVDSEAMPSIEHQRLSISFLQKIGVINLISSFHSKVVIVEIYARINNLFSNDEMLPTKYIVSVNFQRLAETLGIYREYFGNHTKYLPYFDTEQGRLFIGKESVRFIGKSYALLKALFCDIEERNYLEDGADIDFIKETISNGGMDTEWENKEIYRACKSVNDKLRDKIKVEHFIIVEGSALKISKKYLFK